MEMATEKKAHKHSALKTAPYGNCKVFDKNDNLLFRCSPKRINWYIKRNLAEIIQEDPLHIKLHFETKNKKNDLFLLSDKENRCVVCGTEDDLSKHHIVPRCYRVWFPVADKSHNSHDVLPLCLDCHIAYENAALERKRQFADQFNAPLHGVVNEEHQAINKALGYARNLVEHDFTIPQERKEKMIAFVIDILELPEFNENILLQLAQSPPFKSDGVENKTHGQIVVDSVEDIDAFSRTWREHFINEMDPKFLPQGWSITYKMGAW